MTFQYRITLRESERGWGSNDWHEYYDTPEEARDRINEVNSHNTAPVAPDYYIMAFNRIETIEVDE